MFGKFMKCIFRIQLSLDIFALLYIITFIELLQKRENIIIFLLDDFKWQWNNEKNNGIYEL